MNVRYSSKQIKICFVALTEYPLLAGKSSRRVIGPSIHQVLLAKELVKHNFNVSFVTYGNEGPSVEHIDGIEVIKTYREDSHLNLVAKAFYIWKAMLGAKADIYFHHAGASGVTSPFCRLMRRKFVCNLASDAWVGGEFKGFKLIDRLGYWLDIKLADVVIAQSEFQKEMLRKNFSKESVVIKNHFPLTERGMPNKAKPPIVLWVGSMAPVKQPELFLELAQAMPEITFQMIGGAGEELGLYNRVREASPRIHNLEFLDVIPFEEINGYFRRASILVNTSIFEGFPYAFIQAWMSYMPVVSLNSDPDEVICKNRLGFHSKTFSQLIEDIKSLLGNEQLRLEMGENGRRYVEENHDINRIVKQHIRVLAQLCKK
jgi:glycosyltransferase involved in cell wall biosynthesis